MRIHTCSRNCGPTHGYPPLGPGARADLHYPKYPCYQWFCVPLPCPPVCTHIEFYVMKSHAVPALFFRNTVLLCGDVRLLCWDIGLFYRNIGLILNTLSSNKLACLRHVHLYVLRFLSIHSWVERSTNMSKESHICGKETYPKELHYIFPYHRIPPHTTGYWGRVNVLGSSLSEMMALLKRYRTILRRHGSLLRKHSAVARR